MDMKRVMWLSLVVLLAYFANAGFMEELIDLAEDELVGARLAGPIGGLFGNERVNLYVTLEEGESVVIGIISENKKVVSFEEGELTDPTLNAYVTEEILTEIIDSDDSLQTFQEALEENEISYEAVGFSNKMKFGVSRFFFKIVNWFS